MKVYELTTYEYNTYSYSGVSVQDQYLFKTKESAIKYGTEILKLDYLENSDLAFDQDSDTHFTVDECTVLD